MIANRIDRGGSRAAQRLGRLAQERAVMGIDVKVEGPARLDPELDTFLKQAQAALEVIVGGRWSRSVEATWTVCQDDTGRSLISLTLTDRSENLKVSADFSPDELKDADRLSRRLREIWGDLLHAGLEAIGDRLKTLWLSEGVAL